MEGSTYHQAGYLTEAELAAGETELHLSPEVFEGKLNLNFVFEQSTPQGTRRFILRVPRTEAERFKEAERLYKAYEIENASSEGVSFKLRSLAAQAYLMDRMHELDLHSVEYIDRNDKAMLLPFIEGQSIIEYMPTVRDARGFEIINRILTNMMKAHRHGIIMGDRWGGNTIITPNGSFLEFDFDMELTGEQRKTATFEIAQVMFALLRFAGENRPFILQSLTDFIYEHPEMLEDYDPEALIRFLQGNAEFYSKHFVGTGNLAGITAPEQEAQKLIGVIRSFASSPNRS